MHADIWTCRRWLTEIWAMENPVGLLRQFMGRPAFNSNPWQFGARSRNDRFVGILQFATQNVREKPKASAHQMLLADPKCAADIAIETGSSRDQKRSRQLNRGGFLKASVTEKRPSLLLTDLDFRVSTSSVS